MCRSLFTCLLSLLLFSFHSFAQKAPHRIEGMADAKPGKIRLRWSPASYISWEMGNKYGYTVERFTVSVNGVLVKNPQPTLLTLQPLKPYSLQQMETASHQDDRITMIAELIYGEGAKKISPEESIGAYFENQSQNDWRMAMALLTCDLSINAATAAGLYLEDNNVKTGERYTYRIAMARQPKNLVIDTAYVSACVDEPMLLARPQELAIVCSDSAVTLGWLTTFSKHMYSAYIVERAVDGKNFKPVSPLPVIPTETDKRGFSYYLDSLPDNDNKYTYRIKGITPFGDYGPYSQTVEGIGVPEVADRPVLDTIIVIDNKKIEIRWLLPGGLAKQLDKIIITRGDNGKGPFLPIATLKSPAYTFTDMKPLGTNYYRIKGITKRGKAIYSFPYFAQLIDSIPPAIPVGLTGVVDTTGIVTLKWKDNTEQDLQGYRVFRANSDVEEYVEVTTEILNQPGFSDTISLHTLTSKIFYKIIAVDKNYNPSGYTPPLILKRPDTIAPSSPVMTKTFMSDSLQAIVLEWINSSSTDVIKYELYSVRLKDSVRKQVAAWDTTIKREQYVDTALQLGNTYYYELIVYDDAGNHTTELSGEVWYETGKRPAVKTWKGAADTEKKLIALSWQYSQPAVTQYRIYRAKNEYSFMLYTSLPGNVQEWQDKEIAVGNVYKYKITAVMEGDVKAEMSKVIEVKF